MNIALAHTPWQAELQLEFTRRADKTVLSKNHHQGPLVVQKPFYPGDGACHVYLLHPPGGLVGGDRLHLQVEAKTESHTLITTPAANKFYRSAGPTASIDQSIHVGRNASLEWLPQETILYREANARLSTRIDLEQDGKFIGWEIVCLGRPASNEIFEKGRCEQRIELWRNDIPLLIERTAFTGDDPVRTATWGYAHQPVSATLMATPVSEADITELRDALLTDNSQMMSMTLIDGVLLARYLGQHVRDASRYFQQIWQSLRPRMMGVPAMMPRIWAT